MPKTASKRAQSRRMARVRQAHESVGVQPVVRRVPTVKRPPKPTGARAFLRDFPVATTIFVLLLLGLGILVAKEQRVGPFAPAVARKPTPVAQATCDLKTHVCTKAPVMTIDVNKTYTATIKTAKGDIVIQLDVKNTPITVNNFVFLAEQKWYDGTYFWRVETPGQPSPIDPTGQPSPLSLIQGGSFTDTGRDPANVPGYTIKDEKGFGTYTAGSVAMANTGQPNTGSAQFFIDTGDNTKYFSPSYTIFGQVISGLDVAKQIAPKDKILSVTIAMK